MEMETLQYVGGLRWSRVRPAPPYWCGGGVEGDGGLPSHGKKCGPALPPLCHGQLAECAGGERRAARGASSSEALPRTRL
ncbi:hypothetical protein AAFF_G00048910 [Aldrovandia affinis]|uniref:Uncharacterized protein n=1 Tax=Aldrovandia affinis TaxID=143900 RepID=A0AAD7S3J7_9TELE|nr:hypothetical protein AAFF_G00048910 [Aldrovandia affinis]